MSPNWLRRVRDAFDPGRNLRALFCRPERHIPAVDGLRAISILVVVVFHVFFITLTLARTEMEAAHAVIHDPLYINWVWRGELGVDMFFAISGFLIACQLFRQQDTGDLSLGRFYWRRFLRIYPMLAATAAIYVALEAPRWQAVWANLLFINNFRPWDDSGLEWTWSLAIEEQFYLTFPLFVILIFARVRHRFALLLGLFVCTLAVRAWVVLDAGYYYPLPAYTTTDWSFVHGYLDRLYTKPYTRAGPIVAGVLAAYVVHAHRERWATLVRCHGVFVHMGYILVMGLTAYFWIGVPTYNITTPIGVSAMGQLWLICARTLVGVAVALTILMAHEASHGLGRAVRGVLGWRIWYPLAQLSYSIYLLHVLVIYGVMTSGLVAGIEGPIGVWTFIEAGPVIFGVSLVASAVTYLAIERPLMNLR